MSGPEFRELLRISGLSQNQLSENIGVSPNTVSRWVNGILPVPRYAIAYLGLKAVVREAVAKLGTI